MPEQVTAHNAYEFNTIRNRKCFDVSAILTAYQFDLPGSGDFYWEQYNFSQIFLVLEGQGTYLTEQGEYPFGPGMMLYRPSGRRSGYRWEPGAIKFALISFVCNSEAMADLGITPLPLQEEESATLLDVIRTTVRVCEPLKDSDSRLGMRVRDNVPDVVLSFIYASLERFLTMVYCRRAGIDLLMDESQKVSKFIRETNLVTEIKAYLAEHVTEKLTIGELCEHFWMSQTALTKKFRAETG